MKTSEKLKLLFEKSGKSYAELEKLTGVSKSSLQRYANDLTDKIPVDVVSIVAEKLNADASYLMGWTDVESESANIYGDHQANLKYFNDKPELLEIYKEINDSNTLQLLFDQARDLTPEDLETVLMIIKGIKSERGI